MSPDWLAVSIRILFWNLLLLRGLIPGSFETVSIDQPVRIGSMCRMTKSSWLYHTSIPSHCCCWHHSCYDMVHTYFPCTVACCSWKMQELHRTTTICCTFRKFWSTQGSCVHPCIVYTQLILKISLCLCQNLAVMTGKKEKEKMWAPKGGTFTTNSVRYPCRTLIYACSCPSCRLFYVW